MREPSEQFRDGPVNMWYQFDAAGSVLQVKRVNDYNGCAEPLGSVKGTRSSPTLAMKEIDRCLPLLQALLHASCVRLDRTCQVSVCTWDACAGLGM
jgi:hypothetical protein